MLAHCLASFKSMVKDQAIGEIPDVKTRSQWLLTQYSPETDEAFLYTLLEQLGSAAIQLEHLAIYYQLSPLELTLEHLISSIQGRLGNDQ
ncbi:hypothetical protein EV10_0838 [Prochlorococcus marinus str. SS51]|nr:hypothetical protein EV08_0203 [Prochlorococcus marinus str. SS2]KGG22721.1 hypothetical protein EV09_1460 [Prochlorococcus marinus str. SS35]KGG32858.1 hypothetical protein EV10_0838 [Prochlorococcus marinus str. SS51]